MCLVFPCRVTYVHIYLFHIADAVVVSSKPSKPVKRTADKRYHRICPVPACSAKAQKKLSNHLTYAHPNLSKSQRAHYLSVAKREPKKEAAKPVLRLRGQLSLKQVVRPPTLEEIADDGPSVLAAETGKGTREFSRYNIRGDTTLISFRRHLTSIDGKRKSEKVADEMATDVSKFLKFATGSAPVPDWEKLLDRDMLLAYLSKLERFGCGPDGRVTKLDAFDAALRFIRLDLCKDNTNDQN